MIVVGQAQRKGEYQGQAYDNMMIYCLRSADTLKGENGQVCEIIKIKTVDYDPNVCKIGNEIKPVYNRFGQVVDIELAD